MTDPAPMKFKSEYTLMPPQKQHAYPVTENDWDHLKKKVEAIQQPGPWRPGVPFTLVGISVTAFLEAWIDPGQMLFWIIFCASLVGAFAAFWALYEHGSRVRWTRNHVLDEMTRIEERWAPDQPARQSADLADDLLMRKVQAAIDRTPSRTS